MWMWTAPVDLPEGVEQLAGPAELGDPGCIFSLAVMPECIRVCLPPPVSSAMGSVVIGISLIIAASIFG